MPYYRRVGDIPAKRHVLAYRPDGVGVYAEELMGARGFSGASALLYHQHSPSALVAVEPVADTSCRSTLSANEPLLPWHLRTPRLDPVEDAVAGRRTLLGNSDVVLSLVPGAREPSALYRNAAGDELVFVQAGGARVETVFGVIDVGPGDYVVVPMSTTQRWVPTGPDPLVALVVESVGGHIDIPARYLSARGQFLEGAPFSERDLRAPAEPLLVEGSDVEVIVRQRAGLSLHRYAHHPFDVVGWDGGFYPFAFNIADFEPIVGRIHQPPPVHQTFEGPGFVVCSFVPRLFDLDPEAIKVPYHHANVDSDEVLYYVSGDFMSRKGSGIDIGSISMHPSGFVHGPQPGSLEGARAVDRTEEVAVMVDSFAPLLLSDAARAVADDAYPWTWARPSPFPPLTRSR